MPSEKTLPSHNWKSNTQINDQRRSYKKCQKAKLKKLPLISAPEQIRFLKS